MVIFYSFLFQLLLSPYAHKLKDRNERILVIKYSLFVEFFGVKKEKFFFINGVIFRSNLMSCNLRRRVGNYVKSLKKVLSHFLMLSKSFLTLNCLFFFISSLSSQDAIIPLYRCLLQYKIIVIFSFSFIFFSFTPIANVESTEEKNGTLGKKLWGVTIFSSLKTIFTSG